MSEHVGRAETPFSHPSAGEPTGSTPCAPRPSGTAVPDIAWPSPMAPGSIPLAAGSVPIVPPPGGAGDGEELTEDRRWAYLMVLVLVPVTLGTVITLILIGVPAVIAAIITLLVVTGLIDSLLRKQEGEGLSTKLLGALQGWNSPNGGGESK
ncbi:hypothetical protein [Nocardia sp. NPDC051832]|uniref:hypothetical protein n=1 Tax=Nocardia sp. NPDC051832 TaxID=3155673 RepID=UPI003418F5A2